MAESAMSETGAGQSMEERVRARQQAAEAAAPPPEPLLRQIRGWVDALVFAYVLAMFIRTYVFELFMIPTGSMTPTLIGDDARQVAEYDWDGDGINDIVAQQGGARAQVFRGEAGGRYKTPLWFEQLDFSQWQHIREASPGRRDMILVNKFAYWFRHPERGEIAVFKVPDRKDMPDNPFSPDKPVFIKRAVGMPGEKITLHPVQEERFVPGAKGRISPKERGGIERQIVGTPFDVNGKPYDDDPLFIRVPHFPYSLQNATHPLPTDEDQHINIGPSEVYMMGDNGSNSSDSRRWGGVAFDHFRGKAVLRYWPIRAWGFLRDKEERK